MKLPAYDDLLPEQRKLYLEPAGTPLFVVGPPGSGKTTLAFLRANFLAEQKRSVMVVTRTNMLVSLTTQLGPTKFETSTMQSFVWYDALNRIGKRAPQTDGWSYNWDAVQAEYTAAKLGAKFDDLVIDEGQNLPAGFFSWARTFGASTLTVFADEDQGLDEQHSTLAEIRAAAHLLAPFALKHNHRNTPEIAAVAEHFHVSKKLPPALTQRAASGEKPRLRAVTQLTDIAKRVSTRFTNRGGSIGVIVQRKVDVVPLCTEIRASLPSGTRVQGYTSDMGGGGALSIRFNDPGVTVLTGESAIGLEFEDVFLQDVGRSLPCTSEADSRRMYMLTARARDRLDILDGPTRLSAEQLAALPGPSLLDR